MHSVSEILKIRYWKVLFDNQNKSAVLFGSQNKSILEELEESFLFHEHVKAFERFSKIKCSWKYSFFKKDYRTTATDFNKFVLLNEKAEKTFVYRT